MALVYLKICYVHMKKALDAVNNVHSQSLGSKPIFLVFKILLNKPKSYYIIGADIITFVFPRFQSPWPKVGSYSSTKKTACEPKSGEEIIFEAFKPFYWDSPSVLVYWS